MENQELESKYVRSVKWSIGYIVIYCILCLGVNFYVTDQVLKVCSICGGLYLFIMNFFVKYKREYLFINGIISAFAVLFLGILFARSTDFVGVIQIGVVISVVDVLSFTKYGKHTVNAKAMSDVKFVSKLIVYGKGKGDELVPTRGIGDHFYYAMWIGGIQHVSGHIGAYIMACLMIMVGVMIDSMIIGQLYKKETYKGFPATIIPFTCVAIVYGACYFM